ncbi:lamin tail domain-containing protein, partial [candidate division KSB1 bacterium]|nr:lamin tail domain-containing protein [candidate division KSB1 bacterium]
MKRWKKAIRREKGYGMKKYGIIYIIILTGLFVNFYWQPAYAATRANDTIVINEILASSHSLTLDPDYNQFVDWIEIYNSGTTAVDLQGSYLTDNHNQPKKWLVSREAIVPAKGYLLFWADGMDTGRHTNFKLSNAGEFVGLYAEGGAVIDSLSFGKQESDISYGRRIDNPTIMLFYEQPTPGGANSTAGLPTSQQSGSVEVNTPSGFYANSIRVTMSAPGAIRYTTDGSTPTRTSREYASPLNFTSTTVLKARSFATNLLPGPTTTRTFFIDENVTLPTFSLTTDPDFLWDDDDGIYVDENVNERKLWERPAVIEFFEMDGQLAFADEAAIRLFGRSAIYYPQKSLSVFLSNRLRYPLFKDI